MDWAATGFTESPFIAPSSNYTKSIHNAELKSYLFVELSLTT